jgi:hypothetical protein
MTFIRWSAAFASLALAGCFASEPVEVHITPTAYRLGKVESELATPVVDEVIRIKPGQVLIVACRVTKPPRIMQFERELRARHQEVKLTMTLVDEGCPSA